MDDQLLDPLEDIEPIKAKIHIIRGQRVMLDMDLADLYGVETKKLNQAVKRNVHRFPGDFMFQLSNSEWKAQRSQIVTFEKSKALYSKYLPFAFTEQGVAMLSSVLRSKTAIQMNISIMRAFIATRQLAAAHGELLRQLSELTDRVGSHDQQLDAIYTAIENLLDDKAEQQSWADRERIGFKTLPGSEA